MAKWVVTFRKQIIIESKTCLLPMVEAGMFELIGLHRHYKNSKLPFSGGILEQPNYYLKAMELMDDAINDN